MDSRSGPQRLKITFEVFSLFIICTILFLGCRTEPRLSGFWRSESPSAFLYNYTDDGVVLLLVEEEPYQVFRYQIIDDNLIRLYDGMGRIQEYYFQLSADRLTFYTDLENGVIAESFERET